MKIRKQVDLKTFARRHAIRSTLGRIATRGAQTLGLVAVFGAMVAAPWGADARMVYRHVLSGYTATSPQEQAPEQPPARPVPVIDVSGAAIVLPIVGMWVALPVAVSGADSITMSGLPPIMSSRTVGDTVHVRLLSAPPYTPLTVSATITATNSAGSNSASVSIQIGG